MAYDVFSKNGTLLPMADAVIPMGNIEYAYGFGVYENIRAVRGVPLFVEDHLARLLRSAEILGLLHDFSVEKISQWTNELLSAIQADACNLKILLIGARDATHATLCILPLAPLFPDKKLYKNGATAVTRRYERLFPQAKSLNMLGSFLAYRDAKAVGAYDALLVNRHECITEGTRTNFFVIQDRTIISPPKEDILEGVTMMHVLEAAKNCGLHIAYQKIPTDSVRTYDGAFLTSTSSKIMPLRALDAHAFSLPPALHELMEAFDALLETTLQ